MKRSDVFPSKFLKSDDIGNRDMTLTISRDRIEMADFDGDDAKPIITFDDCDKGLVCNVTNWDTIAELYGEESDDWAGKKITLFVTKVQKKGGGRTPGIRIRDQKPTGTHIRDRKPDGNNGNGHRTPDPDFDEFDTPADSRKVANGHGAMADAATTEKFLSAVIGPSGLWTKAMDAWDAKFEKNGELPNDWKPCCNKFQLDNHLVKAAIAKGYIAKESIPEGGWKVEYFGRFTATVFSGPHKAWLRTEIVSYLADCAEKAEAALRKTRPELFDPADGPGDGEVMDEAWATEQEDASR